MSRFLSFCAITSISLIPLVAQAQIKAEHPRNCIFDVGPTQMMFSAFQEGKTDEIFCQHIGDLGQTLIILDARQSEMDDMNIEARVIQNINQKDWRDDLDRTTVTVMQSGKYLKKKNTVSFTHDFSKEGDYILIVRATSDDNVKEYIGQYGFSVGETREWKAVSGALVIATFSVAFFIWRDAQSKAAKKLLKVSYHTIEHKTVADEINKNEEDNESNDE
jgi:hypothetical protein